MRNSGGDVSVASVNDRLAVGRALRSSRDRTNRHGERAPWREANRARAGAPILKPFQEGSVSGPARSLRRESGGA